MVAAICWNNFQFQLTFYYNYINVAANDIKGKKIMRDLITVEQLPLAKKENEKDKWKKINKQKDWGLGM